jgi:hypothetical protein
MAMANLFWIWAFLIVAVGILFIFVGLAAHKRVKSTKLTVIKDVRNPSKPPEIWYIFYNPAKDNFIKMYSNLFRPFRNKINPPFDLSGYKWGRQMFAVRGVLGPEQPEDSNLVPVHIPIVSRAGAEQFCSEVAGGIQHGLAIRDAIEKSGLRIGDDVEFDNRNFTVDALGAYGVKLGYDKTTKETVIVGDKETEKDVKVHKTEIVGRADGIASIRITKTNDANLKPGLANFFDTEFVMRTWGIVPIENSNVVLENQKSAVSSFNSKSNDFIRSKESWATRNQALVGFIMISFVFAVVASILIYTTQGYVHSVVGGAQQELTGFGQTLVNMMRQQPSGAGAATTTIAQTGPV